MKRLFPAHFPALCTVALSLTIGLGSTHAKSEADTAAPWGIGIGGACQAGLAKMGATQQRTLEGGDTLHVAQGSNTLYPGAKEMSLRCSQGKVIALQLVAPKEGMGNPAARAAYQALAQHYKKVAGGPIPQLGDGYARFVKGASVIEIEARHLDFDFTVTYLSQTFYDAIVQSNQKRAQERQAKRAGL